MENKIYPAVFHTNDNGYLVEFPDIPGCLTEGKTIEEAFRMAGDALYCWLENTPDIPKPSKLEDIQSNEIIQLIQPIPYLSEEAKHDIEEMRKQKRCGIVLTCKENLISLYETLGYVSEGISDSVHGNAVWYQMRLKF